MPDNSSPVKRRAALCLAALFAAGAAWRAVVGLNHYRASLAAAADPSIQELEQLNASLEGGLALILLAHGGALFALSRRPLHIQWPLALAVAVLCALVLGAALLGAPLFSTPGVSSASIAVSAAVISRFLAFNWLSLYLGALIGSTLAWFVLTPSLDPFVGLVVVGPCVAFAFLGAGLRILVVRLAGSGRSGRGPA